MVLFQGDYTNHHFEHLKLTLLLSKNNSLKYCYHEYALRKGILRVSTSFELELGNLRLKIINSFNPISYNIH